MTARIFHAPWCPAPGHVELLMCFAIAVHSLYWLDFSHVMAGALWTGTDIFMGFFLGPILRRLAPDQRRAVITWLVPKTMLYLPMLALTTGTAGWFIASWEGRLTLGNPSRPWVILALVVIFVLTVIGLGYLLPNSVRTYLELQKPEPDLQRVFRWNKNNNRLAGVQGTLQVVTILIMAYLAVG